MKKRRTWLIILLTSIISVSVTASFFLGLSFLQGLQSGSLKREMIWQLIEQQYYKDADREKAQKMAEDFACAGLIYSLEDPYSEYLTAESFEALQDTLSGSYYGIGITVSYDSETGYVMIVSNPFHGSPAAKAGILEGDALIQVDDIIVNNDTLNDAITYMKTPKEDGSPLHITWLRDGKEMSADVYASDVVMESVAYAPYDDILYIQITSFDEQTEPLLEEALASAEQSNISGIVLDLRDNPGGVLESAVSVCDMFLPEGIVMYTEDKYGSKTNYYSEEDHLDLPLVVLVNSGSASASEVVAGALQDYDRATILGETTFGKGIVQAIYSLSDGSAVKLTTSHYYTPSGTCIHGTGITPDETVLLPEGVGSFDPLAFDLETDTQLKRAIEILHE